MHDFLEWLREKKLVEFDDTADAMDPTDRFKHNPDSDFAQDHDKAQQEIIKVLCTKYHKQFMIFLNQLADEHRDRELEELTSQLQTDTATGRGWRPKHDSDKDRFMPPTADRGIDPNSVDN